MDVASGYCEGCYRTIEEIAEWGMMSDDRKRRVWQALRQRQATLHPAAPAQVSQSGDAPEGAIPTTAPPVGPPPEPPPHPPSDLPPDTPRQPAATAAPLIGRELPPDAS